MAYKNLAMTITLALSPGDARFLGEHLRRHIDEVDDELIHTENRTMRHALAEEVPEIAGRARNARPA